MLRTGMLRPGLHASCTVIVELQYKHEGYDDQLVAQISEVLLASAASLGAFYSTTVRGTKKGKTREDTLRTIAEAAEEVKMALQLTGECTVTGKYGNASITYDAARCYFRMRSKLLPHKVHLDRAAERASEFSVPAMKVMSLLLFPVERWVLDTNVSYVPVEA